jgi:hypothetical protein
MRPGTYGMAPAAAQANPFNQLDLMDPNLVKKGIEDIREQMRDM